MAGTGSPSANASARASPSSVSVGSAQAPRALPDGFPVMPRAVPMPLPQEDPGLIGLWESDQVGSAVYDFYVDALPTAGYPIVGLYPGGGVALIRFRVPEGEVWQMVARGTADGRVAIEIRLDRA
jgi:hypothetical protein